VLLLEVLVLGLVAIDVEAEFDVEVVKVEEEKLEEVEDEEEEGGKPPSEPKLAKLLPDEDEVEEAGEVACEDEAEPLEEGGGIDPNP
jgi:hypothetical protein